MYPLTLIRLSKTNKISFETKDGRKITGLLKKCDIAMNIHLFDTVITNKDGTEIFSKECFIRGQNLRFVNIKPWVLSKQHLFEGNKPERE